MQSIAHLSVLQLLTIGVLAAVSLFMMCRRKRKVRRRKQEVETAEEKGGFPYKSVAFLHIDYSAYSATTAVPVVVQKPPVIALPQSPLKEPSKGTALPLANPPKPEKKVSPSDAPKEPSKGTAIPMKSPRSREEKPPTDPLKIPASTSDITVMHIGGPVSTARPSKEEPARSDSGDKEPIDNSNPEDEPPEDDNPTGVEPSQEEPGSNDEPGEEEQPEPPTQPMPVAVKEREPTSAKEKEPQSARQVEAKKPFNVGKSLSQRVQT